jgi:calcium binding protein 39
LLLQDIAALDSAVEQKEKRGPKALTRASEDLSHDLQGAVELFEDLAERCPTGRDVSPDTIYSESKQLMRTVLSADIPARLVGHLAVLDFEARKDVAFAFGRLLHVQIPEGAGKMAVEQVVKHPRLLQMLLDGYNNPLVALHAGLMLRDCMKHSALVEKFLQEGYYVSLFHIIKTAEFDVASDAFATLRELLSTNPEVSARFILANFNEFFSLFNALLCPESYVNLRQSLKLLSEMLLSRSYMQVMLRYVASDQYLRTVMNLLRDQSKVIQLEAFQVFKVFAANPHPAPRVQQILSQNKDRLVRFLERFLPEREDDAQFVADRTTVLKRLQAM